MKGAARFPADRPPAVRRVLLLAPSHGLGGGIERYVETLQWSFAELALACHRLDLERAGPRSHARMLADGRALLRSAGESARLVVGHQTLLPVATILARESNVRGMSVLCHGSEAWGPRWPPRRRVERALLRRPDVRAVAASSFTAGSLAADCGATILPPGLSAEWFATLIRAGATDTPQAGALQEVRTRLVTAFRLESWQEKGLPQLIEAVAALGRRGIQLTICGSGTPPPGLVRLVAEHQWCMLRPGLPDREFAHQLASADLFVLATRTRSGGRPSGEGFGLVLLEAQVAGTPVLVPAHGGSSDAYIEGVTGFSPADESVATLASLLENTLREPDRLGWMGKRAAEWGRECFAPGRYVQLVGRRLL
jgi:phosphatidylinositol alpha-1,6-mannosyltransferase